MNKGYATGVDLLGNNYGILDSLSNPSLLQVILAGGLMSYFVYKFILV